MHWFRLFKGDFEYHYEGGKHLFQNAVHHEPKKHRSVEAHFGHVEFDGFSKEQIAWITKILTTLHLPTDNIDRIIFSSKRAESDGLVVNGSYRPRTKTLTLFPKNISVGFQEHQRFSGESGTGNSPEQFFTRVVIHELLHAVSVVDASLYHSNDSALKTLRNERLSSTYQPPVTRVEAETVMKKLHTIAAQIHYTGVSIENYDLREVDSLADYSDSVSVQYRSLAEIEAVLLQTFFINPARLREVDFAQKSRLSGQNLNEFVSLELTAKEIAQLITKRTDFELQNSQEEIKNMAVSNPFPFRF